MMKKCTGMLSLAVMLNVLIMANTGNGASVIVNEYNAVGSEKFLDSVNYEDSDREDSRLGRVMGNGGDWIELVVVEDHADLRNYQIRWWEFDTTIGTNPDAIWATTIDKIGSNQGIITFKDVDFWSDLRSGTIITLSEEEIILAEDTSVVVSGNKTAVNLTRDGDWWINIWTADPDELYVHTETLKLDDVDGHFSVGNDDWEVNIYDGSSIVFEPVGEATSGWIASGINSKEVGKVEVDPSSTVSAADFQDGESSTFGMPNIWHDEITSEIVEQNFDALRSWAPITLAGDANSDGSVDVGDLGVLASNYGQSNKSWSEGDFNGDGNVDVGDLGILASNYGAGVSSSSNVDFDADYAKVFGESDNSFCSSLGLTLIGGLLIAGLMLAKFDD